MLVVRLDQMARNEALHDNLVNAGWDLVVFDEALKLAAHYFGSKLERRKLLMPFSESAFDEDCNRRTGLQARSQIGRAWRPDLHYRSRSSRVRERNPPQEVAHAFL
jgi:hypothetical protein